MKESNGAKGLSSSNSGLLVCLILTNSFDWSKIKLNFTNLQKSKKRDSKSI